MFTEDEVKMNQLIEFYRDTFNRLTLDEEKTLEFYYKLGETRGVDGYLNDGDVHEMKLKF